MASFSENKYFLLNIFLLTFCILPYIPRNKICAEMNVIQSRAADQIAEIKKESFGKCVDGTEAELYILRNTKGSEAKITNYGGTLVSLKIPGKEGNFEDIVLGFDSIEEYQRSDLYFGATIGRYANRIAGAKFSIDGIEYSLARNDGKNNLHGGNRGFDKVFWEAQYLTSNSCPSLELVYLSIDGEEGFPGNLTAKVCYTLTDENELKIDYSATTDKPTIVNLTHHSYFNLAGHGNGNILSHQLSIHADKFLTVNEEFPLTNGIIQVEGTPFDFREAKPIGKDIESEDPQLIKCGGYDHSFVLNEKNGKMALAASVYETSSGRLMEVFTTETGLHLFTANSMDGNLRGKGEKTYGNKSGFCLETQHLPNSPNRPDFPTTLLKPGEVYTSTTIYKFTTCESQFA